MFGQEEVWDDRVKSQAEVYKQDPHVSLWSVQMLQNLMQSNVYFLFSCCR